jgi:hypothetical protein
MTTGAASEPALPIRLESELRMAPRANWKGFLRASTLPSNDLSYGSDPPQLLNL